MRLYTQMPPYLAVGMRALWRVSLSRGATRAFGSRGRERECFRVDPISPGERSRREQGWQERCSQMQGKGSQEGAAMRKPHPLTIQPSKGGAVETGALFLQVT